MTEPVTDYLSFVVKLELGGLVPLTRKREIARRIAYVLGECEMGDIGLIPDTPTDMVRVWPVGGLWDLARWEAGRGVIQEMPAAEEEESTS